MDCEQPNSLTSYRLKGYSIGARFNQFVTQLSIRNRWHSQDLLLIKSSIW